MPHHDTTPRPATRSRTPIWRTPELRAIDDSVANLLRQMVIAMAGMFVAFAASDWISDHVLEDLTGWGSFFTRGITFAVLGSVAIYLTSARPIRTALKEQQSAIERHEHSLEEQTEHHRLTTRLHSAFDMTETDSEAFTVVGDALGVVVSGPAEMLLADSSRAHLRPVAASPAGSPSCGVEHPWGCPAVRRSRTLVFGDSTELDACPRLKDRSSACSAMCVPVTVLGTPMGVLHTVGEVGSPPGDDARARLEALAEQAGSRVGVLRAMAASELQATTDPLTGLLNRRSLEEEFAALRERAEPYAVAFCDLDHFKSLNDTYGHETGDRALRFFSRLLRASVRDADVVCRYGGEEFVVVLPETDAVGAEPTLRRLAGALAEAVVAGEVPEFTVSVGIADSTTALDPAEAIRQADAAMFRAKQAGRNRIVVAEERAGQPSPTDPAGVC